MHSKKKLPYDPGTLPPDKRFCANLSDLFLSGDLAAQRAIPCLQMPMLLGHTMSLTLLETKDQMAIARVICSDAFERAPTGHLCTGQISLCG
jgi:hypothetical protein